MPIDHQRGKIAGHAGMDPLWGKQTITTIRQQHRTVEVADSDIPVVTEFTSSAACFTFENENLKVVKKMDDAFRMWKSFKDKFSS